MSTFSEGLKPLIDATKAEAIEQQIAQLHKDFALLADLTVSAKTFEEVAQRFVDKGLVDTYQPSDALRSLCLAGEELLEGVGDLLFMPDRDEWMAKDIPPGVELVRSKPLQSYLNKAGKA